MSPGSTTTSSAAITSCSVVQVDGSPVVAEVVAQVDEHAAALDAVARPCAPGRGGGRTSGGRCRRRAASSTGRRGRRRLGSRCSRRPPRRRRRRRRTRRPTWASESHCVEYCSDSVTTSSAHTSTYLGSPKSGISLMRTLKNTSGVPSMSSVGASFGGWRRWLRTVPPGRSRGRLRQKLMPACTSATPWSTFSGVSRLMRPSSSSSPQSPQVDPGGRCVHRFVILVTPPRSRVAPYRSVVVACERRFAPHANDVSVPGRASHGTKDFVVSGDGHLLEPTDLFKTRLPKHLRDRAVWEEDFELDEPLGRGRRHRLPAPAHRGLRGLDHLPLPPDRAAARPRATRSSSSRTWTSTASTCR